jgi:demethylmenaquinone methyltransferase/2-methoxy-6-polyprenyl-1,4-benzoquinol methylase
MLEIARGKHIPRERVRFERANAVDLAAVPGAFDAGAAMFWWSHVPRARLPGFLRGLHTRLEPGSIVTFIDNQYVPGNSTPISRQDTEGNTYQQRCLEDGTVFEILKNFPSDEELRALLSPLSPTIVRLRYYWCLTYRTLHHR